ncbi:unnamed protein product [Urochloa humidicola]
MTGSAGKPGARNSGGGGGTCEQSLRLMLWHFAACAQGHAGQLFRLHASVCDRWPEDLRTRAENQRCPTTGWRGNAAPLIF